MFGSESVSKVRLSVKRLLKTALAIPGSLISSTPPYLRVLFYHRINPYAFDGLGPVSRELTVQPEMFESQLQYLVRHSYRSVAIDEFSRMMASAQPIDPKSVLITFDDGYEDNLLWAAPLLRKYGFTAVVFMVSGFIGRTTADVWSDSDSPADGRFLNESQIAQLRAHGIEIGSHTVSHPLLSGLPQERQSEELTTSKRHLENVTGVPVTSVAYPGGDYDASTKMCVAKAGYTLAFTTIPGVNRPGVALTALRRTEVSASDSLFLFKMKMAGNLDWLAFKESPAFRRLIGCLNTVMLNMARGSRANGS